MKLSIITVCKNAGDAIERTLLSVKNQTYNNIEHIVIDGVSSVGDNILAMYNWEYTLLPGSFQG